MESTNLQNINIFPTLESYVQNKDQLTDKDLAFVPYEPVSIVKDVNGDIIVGGINISELQRLVKG